MPLPRSSSLALLLLAHALAAPAVAQSPPPRHALGASAGLLGASQRDAAISPLRHGGTGFEGEVGYLLSSGASRTDLGLRLSWYGLDHDRKLSEAAEGNGGRLSLGLSHLRRLGSLRGGRLVAFAGVGADASALYRGQDFGIFQGGAVQDAASIFASLRPALRLEHPVGGRGAVVYHASAPVVALAWHAPPGQPWERRVVGPGDLREVEQEVAYVRTLSGRVVATAVYGLDWLHFAGDPEVEWVHHRLSVGLGWRSGRGGAR